MSHGEGEAFSQKELGIQWYFAQTPSAQAEEGLEVSADLIRDFQCALSDPVIRYGDYANLQIKIDPLETILRASVRVLVYDMGGTVACEWNSLNQGTLYDFLPGSQTLRIALGPLHLKSGQYDLGVWVQAEHRIEPLGWSLRNLQLRIEGPAFGHPNYILPSRNSQSSK